MKSQKETFASLMNSFGYRYDLRSVFDDFLTMSMCSVTQIPGAGKSHYEDLYLKTVAKYKNDNLRHNFPKLFAQLIVEMEDRLHDGRGNDIVGDYYELNFCRKNSGQFFTPWTICQFMSKCLMGNGSENSDMPLRILDPSCGSGRMLMASAQDMGSENEYYGIDVDHACVKMAALNLFLNGVFHSEIMWADALMPGDFRMSYEISFLPLGIFRIEDKEKSNLWRSYQNLYREKKATVKPDITWVSDDVPPAGKGLQLQLF